MTESIIDYVKSELDNIATQHVPAKVEGINKNVNVPVIALDKDVDEESNLEQFLEKNKELIEDLFGEPYEKVLEEIKGSTPSWTPTTSSAIIKEEPLVEPVEVADYLADAMRHKDIPKVVDIVEKIEKEKHKRKKKIIRVLNALKSLKENIELMKKRRVKHVLVISPKKLMELKKKYKSRIILLQRIKNALVDEIKKYAILCYYSTTGKVYLERVGRNERLRLNIDLNRKQKENYLILTQSKNKMLEDLEIYIKDEVRGIVLNTRIKTDDLINVVEELISRKTKHKIRRGKHKHTNHKHTKHNKKDTNKTKKNSKKSHHTKKKKEHRPVKTDYAPGLDKEAGYKECKKAKNLKSFLEKIIKNKDVVSKEYIKGVLKACEERKIKKPTMKLIEKLKEML